MLIQKTIQNVVIITSMIVLMGGSVQADTITWIGGGDGFSWHDSNNWNAGGMLGVPQPGDDVNIPDVPYTSVVVYSTGTI
ncbi:MAG: hypothetical protein ACYSWZ_11325, partial [Planctomycetota bacterium]